jgi:hypothetical protein
MKMMEKDFENIIKESQGLNSANVGPILSQWSLAKAPLLEAFGGNLIVRSEEPIEIHIPAERRKEQFNNFKAFLYQRNLLTDSFCSFLEQNEEGFLTNRVVVDMPEFGIKRGTKLLRTFKSFIPNQIDLEAAQNAASRYIQQEKITGYLYLSIDPRDYLTISENNYNWRSCHALDGMYRIGNLNYLVDSTTVVAYLADEKLEPLSCAPSVLWNSKKWRMLLHISPDRVVYYNKQYPFYSEELLLNTNLLAKEYFFKNSQTTGLRNNRSFISVEDPSSATNYSLDSSVTIINNSIFFVDELIDYSDYLGYCDLTNSDSYSLAYNSTLRWFYNRQEILDSMRIKIGDAPICPCCGKTQIYDSNDSLVCDYCDYEEGDYDYEC